jgi:hypothetical protein
MTESFSLRATRRILGTLLAITTAFALSVGVAQVDPGADADAARPADRSGPARPADRSAARPADGPDPARAAGSARAGR